jgi:hypothetical protein
MSNTWKPRLLLAALVGALAVIGCFDFGTALDDCLDDERCKPKPCQSTDENDQPDDAFEDTNCDGVDGIAAMGLFVDPLNGKDEGRGTLDDPLRTLGKALEQVKLGAHPVIFLGQGPYHESGLVIDIPVRLYGAYSRGATRWNRGEGFTTYLDGGTVGLVIRGIDGDAGVVIDRLTVASASATDAGMPSIALQVIDSEGIRLRHSTFAAGQGGPGTNGAPGATGTDGGAGQAGGHATTSTASGALAQGGASGCGAGQNGGAGALGPTGGNAGMMGSAGNPATAGGAGGFGADGGGADDIPLGKYCKADNGADGGPGVEGNPGPSGGRGEGLGTLNDTVWVATQQGGNGDAGFPGSGGGGGGSGGSCPVANNVAGAAGGGGGGGGGGGCGGGGGGGGTGGGASISVLLIRSNVQWEGTTTLRTGGGGRGGNGGTGGPGGPGGPGGIFGDGGVIDMAPYYSFGGAGGAGGPGGNGGRGGHGGGGGGGPSVGVWCADAGYANSGSFNTDGLLNGGAGGTTGTGGNPGAPGQKVPFHGCPP